MVSRCVLEIGSKLVVGALGSAAGSCHNVAVKKMRYLSIRFIFIFC